MILDLKPFILLLPLLFLSTFLAAQDSPEDVPKKLGANPIFYIDSIRVDRSELQKHDAESIAALTVLTDSSATALHGTEGKDGVVLIETKTYARKKFVKFFRSASTKYDSLYASLGSDSSFVYVINDKVQKDNYEGNLSSIDSNLFISLEILSSAELKQRFDIDDRKYGILIKSNKPQNLYNKDKKF